jgi:hypothetical protein
MTSAKRPRPLIGLRLMELESTSDSLGRVHMALETEIGRGARMLDKIKKSGKFEAYDSLLDDECDQVEDMLGIAFVACQSFINRIRAHFAWINRACKEDFGRQLSFFASGKALSDVLKRGGKVDRKSTISLVEAIYAIGNFWKHSDEWPTRAKKSGKRFTQVWDLSRMRDLQKPTARVVMGLGLRPSSTGNLRNAAMAIGVKQFEDLSPVRQALFLWAQDVHALASAEFEAVASSLR